ncbi:hypothetical protein FOMPIDRAFT_1035569 [Fomitopsis schrenkii]|uniref:Transmembrane protein n=1 Tax=Fomitopsis schrenkii TaxID=2126942 RepID=S8FPP3_FOMSC|nr:hypothetical protein FOMPIDRAFT_1035569 [Fomitopsis schrenkii]
MMYAQVPAKVAVTQSTPASAATKATASLPPHVKPTTAAEQYWAARALTAETLLSARLAHHGELLALSAEEEEKRAREIAALRREHDERNWKLEIFVVLLLCCLVAIVATVVHSHASVQRATPTRWSIPTHFTIPILSPFTSVVEHEASTLSTRLLVTSTVIFAVLAYACFRYWLFHARQGRC